jgi:uncharacterized delta-60 repeat protein
MPRWIRQLFRSTPVAPVVKPRTRLGFQQLEDRVVPAVTVSALDPLFDTDGKQTYNAAGTNKDDDGRAVAIQTDGKIVVAGSVQQGTGDYAWLIWRYNPDGTLDNSFGSSGLIGIEFPADGGTTLDARANAVVIQADGKIVVGGYSETVTTGKDMTIVRLTTNGVIDTSFDADGIWNRPTRLAGEDQVTALAVQPDGQIVLAGWRTATAPDTEFIVTRLSTAGVIDGNIDMNIAFDLGNGNTDKANAVAIQADGKILVAGSATTSSFGTDMAVARINTNGSLDTTFDGDGRLSLRFVDGVFFDSATGLAIQSDGKILIGGSGQLSAANAIDFGFIRLNTNGSYDTTFDTDGKQTANFDGNDIPNAMVVQTDGKIVLAGTSIPIGSTDSDPLLVRVNSNGSLDTTFDGDGMKRYPFDLGGSNADTFKGVALDTSGRIVAVGSAQSASNGTDVAIVRAFGRDIPLVVDTNADGIDGNLATGKLTLREAIALANIQNDADTITFTSALNAATITLGSQLLLSTAVAIQGGTTGVTISGNNATRLFTIDDGIGTQQAVSMSGLHLTAGNASGEGGAIFNREALTINNSALSANAANSYGGAIRNADNSSLTVNNSTFANNKANSAGGAIYNSGTLTLTNSTVSGNRADNDNAGGETGGGIGTFNGSGSTTTLRNTIVYGNTRINDTTFDNLGEKNVEFASSINNLIGSPGIGGLTPGVNGNIIGAPLPQLGTFGLNGGLTPVFPLVAGSVAINAGSNSAASGLGTDQHGSARVRFGTVDIGAFEFVATAPTALVVDNTGDAFDGDFSAGKLTLREAVEIANSKTGADTITFAAGLGDVVLTSAELVLLDTTGATTINGPSGGTQVVRRSSASGISDFRIFSVNSGATAIFNNLTISNGKAGSGGGIRNSGTTTIMASKVSGNQVTNEGGGIYTEGTLTITNSEISGNTAGTFGGGVHNQSGTTTVLGTTISGNTGVFGGGAANMAGQTMTFTNATLSGNTGTNQGGGLFTRGTTTLTNSTITANTGTGGGLFIESGTTTLNNTIVSGNKQGTTPSDVNGAVVNTSANNLVGVNTSLTGITNGTNNNQIGTAATPIDPLLQPLANNGGLTKTHALGQNSPALGKGITTVANYSVYDQRGAARDNGTPDIGAYEVNHPLATVGAPTTLAGLFQPKPSASANEAFVKGLYQSTLLRAPDAAGLAGWVSQLNSGTSRSTVANGFVNSTENRRAQVTFYYRYFLSREPDTAGLNGWVSQLQAGADEGQVMTGFILSNEFSGQNNNSQFVNLMYYALLSRQADSAGFNGWLNALNGGMSRATVVNAFLRSEEGLNRVVDGMFQVYLKRYGTTGDLGAYRTFLNTNTFGQAATLMLASAEFFTNAGNHLS